MDTFSALLELWGQPLLLSVPVCLLLAAAALPCLSLGALAMSGRRSFYDRCACHLAQPAFMLNWILLICGTIFFSWRFYTAGLPLFLAGFCIISGTLLAVAALIWTLYAKAWKRLRPHPVLLCIAGCTAWLCTLMLPVLGILLLYLQENDLYAIQTWQDLPALAKTVQNVIVQHDFLLLLAGMLFFAIAAGGALSLLWLVLRREHDDYGRDYYTFATKWCASRAAVGGWGTLIIFACMHLPVHGDFYIYVPVLFSAVPVFLASCIWTYTAMRKTPMRFKAGMFCAALCMLISLAGCALLADFNSRAAAWMHIFGMVD